jgi:outer membrane protein
MIIAGNLKIEFGSRERQIDFPLRRPEMGVSHRPGSRHGPGRLLACWRIAPGGAGPGTALLGMLCLLSVLGGSACLRGLTARTAPSPQEPWIPPKSPEAPAPPPVEIPPELLQPGVTWTLIDLVDIGLRNNPQTKAAWSSALAASAGVDIALAAFFPDITAGVTGTKTKGSAIGGRFTFDYSSLDFDAGLSWLLFDFGGRLASVRAARQALAAANLSQNSIIQSVILQIDQAYYQYVSAAALLQADEASLKEAEANLEAANIRHHAGVATIADVLQARTARSQAMLNLVTDRGNVQNAKGALAGSMGLPADIRFEVADQLPSELPLDLVSGEVERYIAEAQANRPDLAAARAQVLQAQANIGSARSAGLPTISGGGNYDRVYYRNAPNPSNNYSLSLSLSIPITVGFANRYRVLQAEAEAETAKAQMEQTARNVVLQVWTSYYNLKTAAQRIGTAQELHKSASESYDVALQSYKRGVANILNLLTAESTLDSARVQLLQARTNWLLSLVQFAHDTGRLGRPEKTPSGAFPVPAVSKGGDRP